MRSARRGVILPAVLFILLLLGLLSGIFAFKVNSDAAATQSQAFALQSRLAAEAGLERVKMLIRTSRFDPSVWYDNPDELHRIIVWTPGGERKLWGTNEDLPEGTLAYRFSVVADDPTDDKDFIRYGITDEAAKLNINVATEKQLLTIFEPAVADNEEINPQELVDAILDWRDADDKPRGQEGDTEGDYYLDLDPPYRIKNGPFDTVEELLLVKGITREVLYGEDMDRNGLLTPNEDDGEATYPPDNQDGKLNRGVYPYLTAMSFESNVSNDQRPRAYLLANSRTLREHLDPDFPDRPEIVDQIISAAQARRGGSRQPTESAARVQREREIRRQRLEQRRRQGTQPSAPAEPPVQPAEPGLEPEGGGGGGGQDKPVPGMKLQARDEQQPRRPQQPPRRPSRSPRNPAPNTENAEPARGESPPGVEPTVKPDSPSGEQEGVPGGQENPPSEPAAEDREGEPGETPSGGTGHGQQRPQPMRSPAALFRSRTDENGNVVPSELSLDLLPMLMDRTTVVPPQKQKIEGLININTAPPLVLRCVDGLSEEQIEAIVTRRAGLEPAMAATTAWLVTEGIVDLETFDEIAPQITARGQQFTVEVLGFADHMGMVTRLEVVVDMVGPVAQTVYYRDVSYLGGSYPIREKDSERKKRVR